MSYISRPRRLLKKPFAWILAHPLLVLIAAFAVSVFAVHCTSKLKVQSNFADLLPESEPAVKELRHLESVVGGASFVVLTLETEESEVNQAHSAGEGGTQQALPVGGNATTELGDPAKLGERRRQPGDPTERLGGLPSPAAQSAEGGSTRRQEPEGTRAPAITVGPFFDGLANRLRGHPDIRYIDYRPPVDFFKPNALLYLKPDELKNFVEKTKRRIDQAKLQNLYVDFSEPTDEQLSVADFEAKYPQFLQTNEFYRSRNGRLSVMLIKPNGRATDISRTKILLGDIERAIQETKQSLGGNDVNVRLTGPYVKALTQNEIVLKDAKRVSILSMTGMLGFILLYFRRKRALTLIGLPLAMSITWAMGTAYLCFGTLNFFTAMGAAVLLGLSTDYGIHLYSRYLEYRREGKSPQEALWDTYSHLGLALWAAAITTICGFLALTISHFKAFYQFGWIIALGMVHCLIAMSTVFPALTILLSRWRPEREASLRIHALGGLTKLLSSWVFGPRPFRIGVAAVILCLVPIVAGRTRFDYNFGNIMGAQTTHDLDKNVDAIFSHSINPEIARAATKEDAAAFAAAVRETKARNSARPEGSGIETALALTDFVPADQAASRAMVADLRNAFTEPVLKLLTDKERETYDKLAPSLNPGSVKMADLPDTVRQKFRDLKGDEGKFFFIFPNFDPQNGRQFMNFVEELRSVECKACSEPVVFSGESVIFYEIVKRMFGDGRWVVAASLLAIWAALLIAFGNLRHSLYCFVPFLVGVVWMLGIMGALNIPFTLVSVAVVPILLGIVIDYPIFLYQQSLHFGRGGSLTDRRRASIERAYTSVCPPIFGSAATTIIGFGCLLTASNGGARSFGLAAVIGLTACMTATLVWFPSWLAWVARRHTEPVQGNESAREAELETGVIG